jgi:phage gpG-like protein
MARLLYKQDFGIRIRGVKEWIKYLQDMEKHIGVNSALANRIGSTAIQKVKEQVSRYEDMDGKKFQKYKSTKYIHKAGHKKNEFNVDLKKTGNMINSIRFHKRFDRNKTVIIVSPEGRKNKVKAWVHHVGAISGRRSARFRMPQRKWFGLQKKNEILIIEMQKEELMRYLSKVSGQGNLFL